MVATRAKAGMMGAMLALAPIALAILPAQPAAASAKVSRLRPIQSVSLGTLGGIGSFTPAAADPRASAAIAQSLGAAGLGGTGFRFTPSSAPGRSRAVTVAVRARSNRAVQLSPGEKLASGAPSLASPIQPLVYNLGMSVGWRRFTLSGDVTRIEGSLLPLDRESADVGLSFSGRRWSTRVQLAADRALGERTPLLGSEQSYSVDLAGSYALTHALELTGGVRYKAQLESLGSLADTRRDSQAVYVGTAFKF